MPLAGIRLFFKKLDLLVSTNRTKTSNEIILFQLDKNLAGMENSFKNKFLLDGKAASIDRNIQKIKKMVANSSKKGFK